MLVENGPDHGNMLSKWPEYLFSPCPFNLSPKWVLLTIYIVRHTELRVVNLLRQTSQVSNEPLKAPFDFYVDNRLNIESHTPSFLSSYHDMDLWDTNLTDSNWRRSHTKKTEKWQRYPSKARKNNCPGNITWFLQDGVAPRSQTRNPALTCWQFLEKILKNIEFNEQKDT